MCLTCALIKFPPYFAGKDHPSRKVVSVKARKKVVTAQEKQRFLAVTPYSYSYRRIVLLHRQEQRFLVLSC